MNKRQKLVQQQFLNNEEAVIRRLKAVYNQSLKDITEQSKRFQTEIMELQALIDIEEDEGTKATLKSMQQSKIYQKQYQDALKKQINSILDKMQVEEFKTVDEYLKQCYEDGFIGTMYDMQGQGIPLCMPLNQEDMVRAVQTDSKISQGLYTRLGEDVDLLKRKIVAQVSRGIATGMSWQQVAQQLAAYTNIGFNNAVRISRTEGHRVQVQSTMDACYKAKDIGADVVKQWDSTLDKRTRKSHQHVDGEIRELDEPFSNGLMFPSDPSGGASEVVNCRCALLQRAKWALDDDELETLKERASYYGLDKTKDFDDYKSKYLNAAEKIQINDGIDYTTRRKERMMQINNNKTKQSNQRNIISEIESKGVLVDVSKAKNYPKEVDESLIHLDKLLNEYKNTVVSYNIGINNISGTITEGGSAYMLNGKTSISIIEKELKKRKATDTLRLGDKQHLGITYHEFAHSLSQSREKINKEFWKEIRNIKKEYENQRDSSNWFDVKISNYASKDIDEFVAESFTQSKLSDKPSIYALRVLEIIDKYFKN